MPLFAEELRWFESADGLLIPTLIRDTDDEFSAITLARDLRERLRLVTMTRFYASPVEALEGMQNYKGTLQTTYQDVKDSIFSVTVNSEGRTYTKRVGCKQRTGG